MGKPRPTRTNEELRAASLHLVYEWEAKGSALVGILKLVGPQPTEMHKLMERATLSTAATAFFDSFAIHARSLTHFFYPEPPIFPEDVLAEDYISDWDAVRPPMAKALESVRSRVGTEFAHLSYRRIPLTEEAMKWPFHEILQGLIAPLAIFIAKVPREKVDPVRFKETEMPASHLPPGTLPYVFPRWPFAK